MNTIATFDTLFIQLLGLLVNASWIVTLLLGAIWVLIRITRRASAAFRSMAWNLGFGAALILPILLVLLPGSWNLGRVNLRRADVAKSAAQSVPPAAPFSGTARAAMRGAPIVESDQPPGVRGIEIDSIATRCAVGCWLVGVLFAFGRFGVGHALLYLRSRRIRNAPESDWCTAAREAARKLQLPGEIRLLQSRNNLVPAVWGSRHPIVFLPASAKWSFERKLAVLLHEFAHIKRRDLQALWLQQFVAALYWFHPVVIFSLAEGRKTCEQACDDMVLDSGFGPCDYAGHLLEISQSLLPEKPACAAFCVLGTSSLENRLAAILDPLASRRAPNVHVKAVVALIIFPLLLLMSATCTFAFAGPTWAGPISTNSNVSEAEKTEPPDLSAMGMARLAHPATSGPSDVSPEASRLATGILGQVNNPAAAGARETSEGKVFSSAEVSTPPGSLQPTYPNATGSRSVATQGDNPVDGQAASAQPQEAVVTSNLPASPSPMAPASRPFANTSGDVILNEGTRLWLSFTENLSSKTAAQGDPVTLVLINDLKVGNVTVATAGSRVFGTLAYARKAMAPGRSGVLKIRLDYLQVGDAKVRLRSSKEMAHENIVQYSRSFHLRWPLGLFRTGDDVEVTPETALAAYVDEDSSLPAAP